MIVVGICSCNRPDRLAALLGALARCRIGGVGKPVRIVVVDNSAEATARPVVEAHAAALPFPVRLAHEPRPGLAVARNRALLEARAEGARLLAFIDDDELPSTDWLANLARAIEETGAAAAVGPVDPLFATMPPPWLPTAAYRAALKATSGFVADGYTGNCILDLAVLDAAGLRFDERFNETGGEDTAFFRSLMAAGHGIAWAESAVVRELVPRDRMRLRWLLSRWVRTGAIEAVIARSEQPRLRTVIACLGKGAVRLAGGSARLVGSAVLDNWRRPDRVVASLYTLCRGIGYVTGAFGRSPRKYGRASPT